MSATRETRASRLAHWLLLPLSLLTLVCPLWGYAGEEHQVPAAESLVRVQFKTKFSGIRYEDRLITQSAVVEINEFTGVLLDSRGFVAAYVGSTWTRLPAGNAVYSVVLSDGNQIPAELVGIDERVSLAVLKVKGERHRAAVMGVLAEGKPIRLTSWSDGKWVQVPFEVVLTAPSDLDAESEVRGRFLAKASKDFGFEEGLVLDESGRFLGFLTQLDRTGLSRSIRSFRVLPVQAVRDSLRQVAEKGGPMRAGWLGIFMREESRRIEVQDVVNDSPAQRAGMLPGDLIIKVGDKNVWSRDQFVKLIRWSGPGTKVNITVEREGRVVELWPILESWADSQPPATAWAMEIPPVVGSGSKTVEAGKVRFYPIVVSSPEHLGLVVEPLTPQLADFFKVPGGKGLLVKSVVEASPAGKLGFRAGDVLVEINGSSLVSPADISRIVSSSKDGAFEIKFVREGSVQTRRVVAR